MDTATECLDHGEQARWRRFIGVEQRLLALLARHLQRDSGLSPADYEVLVHLSKSSQGRMRAFEIGKITQWEKSRLSHHLSRMVQRGLVERQVCAADSRYADIVLTGAGREAAAQATEAYVAYVRHFFLDALSPEQLDALDGICDALLTRLDEGCADETARECAPAEDAEQCGYPGEAETCETPGRSVG